MDEEDIIEILSSRQLNIKTNNYIIKNVDNFDIIDEMPKFSSISFVDYDINLNFENAINIKINLKEINIHNILSYILNYLKELNVIDIDIDLDFNSQFDILRFQGILRSYHKMIQIICKNVECLDKEDQMLFNELYYFNSPFYSITSFVKDDFKTYFLDNDRVLDDRENYTKIEYNKNKQKILN